MKIIQPLDLCFGKIKKTCDYNLQSNKIYGVNDNKIVTYNLNKIEWKKYFKLEEDGWRNYLEDDIDINDTIIDSDMKRIRNLLGKQGSIDKPIILFQNHLYEWKITTCTSSGKIEIIKKIGKEITTIYSKIIYEPKNWILLKNNALLALILVKKIKDKERKILTIFKFYNNNNIRLQYLLT